MPASAPYFQCVARSFAIGAAILAALFGGAEAPRVGALFFMIGHNRLLLRLDAAPRIRVTHLIHFVSRNEKTRPKGAIDWHKLRPTYSWMSSTIDHFYTAHPWMSPEIKECGIDR